MTVTTKRHAVFREAIDRFIKDHLDTKLDKLAPDYVTRGALISQPGWRRPAATSWAATSTAKWWETPPHLTSTNSSSCAPTEITAAQATQKNTPKSSTVPE